MVALEFKQVSFNYRQKQVLSDLSFKVKTGGVTVLLGPNGAGKTTALQLILGLRQPLSGQINVLGDRLGNHLIKNKVGYVPQDLSYPSHLTTEEVLKYVCCIQQKPYTQDLVKNFNLEKIIDTKASLLSGGQKRRLGLALALCSSPELLILDEPTTGLDLESKIWFWDLVKTFSSQNGTVLLTTHDIYEVSAMNCDGLILNHGHAVTQGSMDFLLSKAKFKKISFQSSETIGSQILGPQFEKNNNWYRCWTRDPEEVITRMVQQKIVFTDLQIERGSLEEVLKAIQGQT
jgi:ABC-2 type transport system ATP-binding protein